MKKFKRVFVVVMDSVGIGALPDAAKYGDIGANTFLHTVEANGGISIPTLTSLGFGDLVAVKDVPTVCHPHSFSTRLFEESNGKDTMTGHWEMMGIKTTIPFQTFTDTGFPKELMDELAVRTEKKLIGNCAASGTEILVDLGEQQMKEGSLIVYTSADSVLQIAAHEEIIPLQDLYSYCAIAREICNRPEYMLGRIIARPYLGTDKSNFRRTPNRHDYALSPSGRTAMNDLKDAGYEVSCIGKIYDIFNTEGATRTQKTISNIDGMEKTIAEGKNLNYEGLCFVNLVEFDSEFGHRRNPQGYAECIEIFDKQLKEFISVMHDDDLLLITADHGNDPTAKGSDHTREMVPLIAYSKSITEGKHLADQKSFAVIGSTILANFGVKQSENQIGTPIMEIIK